MELLRFFPKANCLVILNDGDEDGEEFESADISVYPTVVFVETDFVDIFPMESIYHIIISPFELKVA